MTPPLQVQAALDPRPFAGLTAYKHQRKEHCKGDEEITCGFERGQMRPNRAGNAENHDHEQ